MSKTKFHIIPNSLPVYVAVPFVRNNGETKCSLFTILAWKIKDFNCFDKEAREGLGDVCNYQTTSPITINCREDVGQHAIYDSRIDRWETRDGRSGFGLDSLAKYYVSREIAEIKKIEEEEIAKASKEKLDTESK